MPSAKQLVGLKLQKLAGFIQQRDVEAGYEYLLSYWNRPEELMTIEPANSHQRSKRVYPSTPEFVNRAMFLDQISYLPVDNPAKVDRTSMAASLETCLPLLSHEVVDFSWQVTVTIKLQNNTTKWVLQKVLYKYVPQNLIDQPKMGFLVPIDSWLLGELKDWAEDLLGATNGSAEGMLHQQTFRKAWSEHISGKRDHSYRLWTVLMFLSWKNNRS